MNELLKWFLGVLVATLMAIIGWVFVLMWQDTRASVEARAKYVPIVEGHSLALVEVTKELRVITEALHSLEKTAIRQEEKLDMLIKRSERGNAR